MDKYLTTYGDPYVYSGTDVLINLFNIKDLNTLEKLETELTWRSQNSINYQEPPYSLDTMQDIHRTLFKELYDWAGELRRCDIVKGDTRFCNTNFLEREAARLFRCLERDNWLTNLSLEQFCEKLAEHYAEFNMLHPFREGNGRTQRILFDMIAAHSGYQVSWGEIERDEWLYANQQGVNMNYNPMTELFRRAIS